MAFKCVQWIPDQVVWVHALLRVIVFSGKIFYPHSAAFQEYKWVQAKKLLGTLTECCEETFKYTIQGGGEGAKIL